MAVETLRWLPVSLLLTPIFGALGLWGLLSGLPLIGLLVGAIAARWPDRFWFKPFAAMLLSGVELLLVRRHGVPWLAGQALPLLIAPRTVLLLGSVAPALSAGLAAALVPRWLTRRLLSPPER